MSPPLVIWNGPGARLLIICRSKTAMIIATRALSLAFELFAASFVFYFTHRKIPQWRNVARQAAGRRKGDTVDVDQHRHRQGERGHAISACLAGL